MILVQNRELIIPNNERYIGSSGDEASENRVIRIPRVTQSGVDIAGLYFYMDLRYYNEEDAYDTVILTTGSVEDEYIELLWPITTSQLQVPGTIFGNIRAMDTEGTVKWQSFKAAFYVEEPVSSYTNYTGSLTELEQLEVQTRTVLDAEASRVTAEEGRVAAEEQRELERAHYAEDLQEAHDYAEDSEAYAKGTRSGEAVSSDDPAYQHNAKFYADLMGSMVEPDIDALAAALAALGVGVAVGYNAGTETISFVSE